MWNKQIELTGERATNRVIELAEVWGKRANELQGRMEEAASLAERAAVLRKAILAPGKMTAIQSAIHWMETRAGCVSLDEVARLLSLSSRQFWRLCIKETGLSPKFWRVSCDFGAHQIGSKAGLETVRPWLPSVGLPINRT